MTRLRSIPPWILLSLLGVVLFFPLPMRGGRTITLIEIDSDHLGLVARHGQFVIEPSSGYMTVQHSYWMYVQFMR